ncbi:MAG: arylsulfatase [Candidatus Aminicenantes bacterium]|nr:arylsulfatase [Candidatus Aminicenantes bacterium]
MKKILKRRCFMKMMGAGAAAVAFPMEFCKKGNKEKPNIIFFLADDLGYGELGCYGQKKIRTPHIDRMAAEGMRFTQHYAGSTVCAPSRCVLLTGKHTGHAYIRDNDEMGERGDVWHDPELEGQRPLPAGTTTIGSMLQRAGYTTGVIGKWGLGGPHSSGEPNKQGFDHWYGYLCQRVAHNYYPTHLWRNGQKHVLEGNRYFFPHQRLPKDRNPNEEASYDEYSGKQYSLDLMVEEAVDFIQKNKDQPFFLYVPFTVPHAAIQVPKDSLDEYTGAFPEVPYKGEKGYLPHPVPRAGYAAMITRMDRGIGRIMKRVKKLGLDEKTMVLFSSDNGPTFNGGTDSTFFNSAGPLRGLKTSLYEGGIRVPLVVRWPGFVKGGAVSSHISAFWDFMPTFAETAGIPLPENIDGISLLPVLTGHPQQQKEHEYLYWEYKRRQAVRFGKWKAYRSAPEGKLELYDLEQDVEEQNDVSASHPKVAAEAQRIFEEARTESQIFPLVRK